MTMVHRRLVLAAALLSTVALSNVQAADIIDTGDPAVVLTMVKNYGDATPDRNSEGEPIIMGTMDGKAYVVFFQGCKEGVACQSLRFYARWDDSPLTLEQVNDYNGRGSFARATVRNGSVALQMDVDLVGGTTAAHFSDTIEWFKGQLGGFRQQYAEKTPE